MEIYLAFHFKVVDMVINFPKICLKPKNSVVLDNTQHTQSFSKHLKILQRLWLSEIKLSKIYLLFLPQNVNALAFKKAKLPTLESEGRFSRSAFDKIMESPASAQL